MIFKNLTFDGISLKEYGVYISGEAVFDSPTREVEMITIPGRNGSFALDKGRFNNITVTYPAGIYATNETEFAEKVSTLRNLLASRKGYCRLTDEYNPDEFRLGVYKAGLELDPTHYNEAGRFELSFDCKPQRFLFSGEEVFTLGEWGQTETKSGSVVSFEGDETTAIKSLTAQIVPKQSGSGDPSPSNVRPISGYSEVNVNVSGGNLFDADTQNIIGSSTERWWINVGGSYLEKGGASNATFALPCKPNKTYKVTVDYSSSIFRVCYGKMADLSFVNRNTTQNVYNCQTNSATGYREINISTGDGATYLFIQLAYGMHGTAKTTINVLEVSTTYTTSLGQTVYGGVLDVVSGVLTSFPYYSSYNGQTLSGRWICDRAVYSQGTTPPTGSQVVDMSGNGTEVTLTPTEVSTLLGQNNIWADSGDVTVEIGQNPYILVNPTLFEACPLIEFNSSGEDGEINLGSRQIKVLSAILGRINLGLDVSGSRTTTRTWQDVITVQNAGSFNAGDILRFNGGKVIFTFNFTPINVEVVSQGTDLKASWQRGSNNLELSLNNLEFPAGTDTTYQFTCDIKVKASQTPSIEGTETFTVTTSYNRNGVLTITWAGGNYSFGEYTYIQGASNYTGYGDSTKNSLEDVDIYIDLDIGEAYSVDSSDNVVSLNNFVNLGGELPTLDPGATEISTDDSISNVKVTPRWWKV